MLILFVVLLCFVVYTYIGYYFYLKACVLLCGRKEVKKSIDSLPDISIIISARNECRNIRSRINNLIECEYPKDKLEIIIVSDASTDGTVDEIIRIRHELAPGIKIECIELTAHSGKPTALNMAVQRASGECLVFADARQSFERAALLKLVGNFSDPKVGCVSGQLVFREATTSNIKNEVNAYWDFEKEIRMLESETGSVLGATGAIYALRKCLYQELPAATLLDDVLVPMNAAMRGYRVIFEKDAIAYDVIAQDYAREKTRKIRTLAGNWQLLILKPALLIPVYNPLFFRFLSHKLFRVMVPYAILAMMIVVLMAGNVRIIALMLAGMAILAGLLVFDKCISNSSISNVTKLTRAFLYLNYFALLAPFKLIFSRNLWQK